MTAPDRNQLPGPELPGPVAPGPVLPDRELPDRELPDRERAERVWAGLRELVLERYDRRREAAAELGLGPGFLKLKALWYLGRRGPMSLRELAAILGAEPPYVTVLVQDLVVRGLVDRSPDPGDRRRKLVRLTPEGTPVADRAGRILQAPPEPLSQLTSGELAELDRIVAVLLSRAAAGPAGQERQERPAGPGTGGAPG